MMEAYSASIDNSPNLKVYPTHINKITLHNNSLPVIITHNSDNKVWISKNITIGTSEEICNGHYSISEITLTAKMSILLSQ